MNKLSTKHFIFFILGVSLIALRSYSSIFIRLGGRDTALIATFASIAFILFVMYLLKICAKTNTYNLTDIFYASSNKFIGNIFLFIFIFGLFLISVESSSVEASSIHTNFFLATPTWYCLLFFIVPAAFVLTKKLNTILIIVIVTVTLTLLGDVLLLVLISGYLNFNFVLPILKDGITANVLSSFILILGSLSSVAIVLPYLKYVNKKDGLIKDSTLATILASLLIISSILSYITFFGPERAGNIFYPEFVQSQRIQIANFFEFGELFYIFRSVCMWFVKYILSSYAIIILLNDKFKNIKVFVIIYSVIIFLSSWYLTKNQFILFDVLKYLQPILLISLGIIPLISFTLYYLRKKSKIQKI